MLPLAEKLQWELSSPPFFVCHHPFEYAQAGQAINVHIAWNRTQRILFLVHLIVGVMDGAGLTTHASRWQRILGEGTEEERDYSCGRGCWERHIKHNTETCFIYSTYENTWIYQQYFSHTFFLALLKSGYLSTTGLTTRPDERKKAHINTLEPS